MRACIAVLCALVLVAQSPEAPIAVRFVDDALRAGIHFTLQNHATPEKHQVEAMPAGVAVLDFDNDGFEDLYFVNGAHVPDLVKTGPADWNRLYAITAMAPFATSLSEPVSGVRATAWESRRRISITTAGPIFT
jgi:hypothetical protein